MEENQVKLSAEVLGHLADNQNKGRICACVSMDQSLLGTIVITDMLKPESCYVIEWLQESGIKVFMVTGDNKRSAVAIGRRLGLEHHQIFSQVTPSGKAGVVKQVQEEVEKEDPKKKPVVMFVGDGVNDSPALAQADVGVAIGAGTDIAIETAQVVLMREELTDILTAIDLSQKTLGRIYLNYMWACMYNVFSIPIAAGVLYPWLLVPLPPVVAALAMALSSCSVVLSSLALKNYRRPHFDGFFDFGMDLQTIVVNPAAKQKKQRGKKSKSEADPKTKRGDRKQKKQRRKKSKSKADSKKRGDYTEVMDSL